MAYAVSAKVAPVPKTTGFASLKPAVAIAPKVVNNTKANEMMVWSPFNNKFFETFSFLPPLHEDEIARQVDYILREGWVPCLEFAEPGQAYIASNSNIRFGNASAGYYDNRYWAMWKLPFFGCNDPVQVLNEIDNCVNAFPDVYVRLVAFDNITQTQMIGFLVHRPRNAHEFRSPDRRSV